jgi:hypothetical protein
MDEEYRGPATLRVDDADLAVEVRMSVRFEPVEGRFRWAGRTGPSAALRARVGGGLREASLRIGAAVPVTVRLGDPDPWGGIRISGTGMPPWSQGEGAWRA